MCCMRNTILILQNVVVKQFSRQPIVYFPSPSWPISPIRVSTHPPISPKKNPIDQTQPPAPPTSPVLEFSAHRTRPESPTT